MSISAIQPVGFDPAVDMTAAITGTRTTDPSFGSMVVAGVNDVDNALKAADAQVVAFSVGESLPPHQIMLALEKARLELQFALQVRSKLVEGYQELMRMQI